MSYFKTLSFYIKKTNLFLLIVATLVFSGTASAEPLKVAFIGDQGVKADSQSVLSLVASEGTDLLLIQGDLGYADNTARAWEQNLNTYLGKDFPVLTLVGNHENFEWPSYQRLIDQRINRIDGLRCSGNIGVKAKCSYGNIDIVQVAPAIYEVAGIDADDNYADFIRSSFRDTTNQWRICSWHKPHNLMQTGGKSGPGWDVYDACLDAGAMVANAHEHAYSRTYLLSDFRNQTIVHKRNQMALQPGQSFSFVSGLGGREVRRQVTGGDWFASIYTADQGATHGALFCTFEDDSAECYFKAINGAVPDQFSLTRHGGPAQDLSPPPPAPSTDNAEGYVFSRTDKDEFRWIEADAGGRMSSVWIDQACASRLGGISASGTWSELTRLAPGFDAINNPCTVNNVSAESSTPEPLTSVEDSPGSVSGYVFSRSDKEEYRWIDNNASNVIGSVWIDKACAQRLGGPKATGDWSQLMTLAPAMDSINNPCELASAQGQETAPDPVTTGFTFARTDKNEYRWIDKDASGNLGSVWVDKACADRLGGTTRSGDWKALMTLAPGLDTIAYPCTRS